MVSELSPKEKPFTRMQRWLPLFLFAAALLWRLPYTLTTHTFYLDETAFAHPTIRQIGRGEFPIYLYSNTYMAPAQEWLSASLVALWGENLATLRLPCVLCGCLAIVLFFRNLRRVVSPSVAAALCIPLVCTNSYTGVYTAFGIPSYAVATVFAALLQAATFQVERRRTLLAWIGFGALAGFSAYIFKILALQFGVSLLWLLLRSDAWERNTAALRVDLPLRRRLKLALIPALLALCALAPVAYRYLTRPDSYTRSQIDTIALLIAGASVVCAFFLARAKWRSRPIEWACALAGIIFAAAVYLPPELYFVLYEKPRLAAEGVKLWEGSRYSLKHIHEWGFQARLFLEHVFATFLTGRVHELGGGVTTAVTLGWRAALIAVFSVALAAGAVWRWLRGDRPDFRVPHWVFIGPFLLVTAILLPSWRLNNEWSGRYLIVFQIGFHLMAYVLFAPAIHRHPRVFLALLLAYAAYCGLDTYWHSPA